MSIILISTNMSEKISAGSRERAWDSHKERLLAHAAKEFEKVESSFARLTSSLDKDHPALDSIGVVISHHLPRDIGFVREDLELVARDKNVDQAAKTRDSLARIDSCMDQIRSVCLDKANLDDTSPVWRLLVQIDTALKGTAKLVHWLRE